MPQFTSTVDKRSRQKMVDFLSGHFRYDTMGSWNRCRSYAHNVKLHRLGLTSEQYDAASSLIHADDDHWQYEVRQIIEQFTERHNGYYTIGQNGRSGGYMVLYQSQYKQSEYKSRCRSCGQRSYQAVTRTDVPYTNKCGRCGAEAEKGLHPYTARELTVWSGRGLDQEVDWEDKDEWSMSALKRRVELIQDFDSTVQSMRDALIYTIENFEVADEVVMVPKKVTVVQPRGGV